MQPFKLKSTIFTKMFSVRGIGVWGGVSIDVSVQIISDHNSEKNDYSRLTLRILIAKLS